MSLIHIPALFGLVLSGGKSSRMGSDKGSIQYQHKPQRAHVFELLSRHCTKVFTSCREEQRIDEYLNPLLDAFDFEGPLNGILSAFTQHPDHAWMVMAIDMPNIDDVTLKFLSDNRDPQKPATCFYDEKENAPEPLLTIFEPSAFPLLMASLTLGNKSPRYFLKTHVVHLLKQADPDLFLNINFPHQRDEWIKRG